MIFDLAIIGGGPAGYMAAERAAQGGLKTIVFEERAFGGVCLNEGCIPSKTFLHSAILVGESKEAARFGVKMSEASLDFVQLQKRKNKIIKKLVLGVRQSVQEAGATIIESTAKLAGREGENFVIEAAGERYLAAKLLLAAGSKAIVPPMPGVAEGLEKGFVLTNREILDLKEQAQSLVVVGGGVIGLEMAAFFALLGTKVTVIEMLDHIAGAMDRDLSNGLQEYLSKLGVSFELGAKVLSLGEAEVVYEAAGERRTLSCDKVLMSIGRRARTAELGLESIGLDPQSRGLEHDEHMQTEVPGVYVAGDLTGRYQLAHVAYREAEVAVRHIQGLDDQMSYRAVPSVVYGPLEAASVGPAEIELQEKEIPYEKIELPLAYAGRFLAETERVNGFCKLLLTADKQQVLACHILGSYASEIIFAAGLMIAQGMNLEEIRRQIFPHPTVGEIIREAVYHC